MKILTKKIDNNCAIWFSKTNSYLVLNPVVAEVLLKINDKKIPTDEIELWAQKQLNIPADIAKTFVNDVKAVYKHHGTQKRETQIDKNPLVIPSKYSFAKNYTINNFHFLFEFEDDYLESLIHPIFSHLENTSSEKIDFHYQLFYDNDFLVFVKNKQLIGKWQKEEAHVFQGKISMHLLIDIYKKSEENWMGVFHASAVSNGKEAMLFLGDSGNGKSTSLAILNANGFDCIADDFVPIDHHQNIRTYPAAISVKKSSLKTLSPFYPELKNIPEYHLKNLHKVVKYLPPKNIDFNLKLKCKALVFIKYNPTIEFELKEISKTNAFQQLVPDSWISPLEENTNIFLDWFLQLPCYSLTYANNQKMIETVSKIFNNEL